MSCWSIGDHKSKATAIGAAASMILLLPRPKAPSFGAPPLAGAPAPALSPPAVVVLVELLVDVVEVVEVGVAVQYPLIPHVSVDLQHSLSQQLPLSGQAPAEQQVSVSGL